MRLRREVILRLTGDRSKNYSSVPFLVPDSPLSQVSLTESAVLLDLPELKKSNSSLVLSLVPVSPLSQVSSRVSAVLSVLPEEEKNKTCSSDPSLVPDSPLSQVSSTVLVVSSVPLEAENRRCTLSHQKPMRRPTRVLLAKLATMSRGEEAERNRTWVGENSLVQELVLLLVSLTVLLM